jgi:hypothetical protein
VGRDRTASGIEQTPSVVTWTYSAKVEFAVLGLLVTSGPGYRLDVDPMAVDAERFVRLARLGRESLAQDRPDTAVPTLEDALRLWRGPAYAGFQDTRSAGPRAGVRTSCG